MSASTLLQRTPLLPRVFSFLLLLAALLIFGGWQAADLAAQNSGKKPSKNQEEEEDPPKMKKQKGKKAPDEEEDTSSKGKQRKPVPKVDEEGDENPDGAMDKTEGESVEQSFQDEARQAKHPLLKKLFQDLAKPYDLLIKANSRTRIEPYHEYLGLKPNEHEITVLTLRTKGKAFSPTTYNRGEIRGIDPYENIALTEVSKLLKKGTEADPDAARKPPTRMEVLDAAEKALELVSRFHQSGQAQGRRRGAAWEPVAKALDKQLVDVRLAKLRTLIDQKESEAALTYGNGLADKYPGRKDVLIGVASLLASLAEQSLKDTDYKETRNRLLLLENQFPDSPEVKAIREKLAERAREKWEQAKNLERNKDIPGAIDALKTAESIYSLPGLHDDLLRLSNKRPVLYVGVKSPPINLSPTTAVLDEEKQAVELLFDSLVKLASTEKTGQVYKPDLASDLPRMVPLGREFRLSRKAFWSDGKPVTAIDVRRTVQLLSDANWPGFAEWANLMKDGAHLPTDNYTLTLTLRQGYLDPLALMDFKVMPGREELLKTANEEAFAQHPIGSGPYYYAGRQGEEAVFLANPYYQNRGKPGEPQIREIRFFHSQDPAADFGKGKLHLLLDLTTDKLKAIDSLKPEVTIKTIRNRRIYFLAVNHDSTWLKSVNLRRALAHAIDREKILKDIFRKDEPSRHRALSSPYPPDSWACKNKTPLYDINAALAQIRKTRESHSNLPKLQLLYPNDDPTVKEACEAIRDQVRALGDKEGIDLDLVPLSPRDLMVRVEKNRDYELAYYYWDYANEAYWLWPLLDSQAVKGGRNFLNYKDDSDLDGLFRQAMTYRQFAKVQEITHSIDDHLYEQMPLIPLWQLDTLLAVHKSVTMKDSAGQEALPDPLLIFTNIEKWKKEEKK